MIVLLSSSSTSFLHSHRINSKNRLIRTNVVDNNETRIYKSITTAKQQQDEDIRLKLKVYVFKKYGLLMDDTRLLGGGSMTSSNSDDDYLLSMKQDFGIHMDDSDSWSPTIRLFQDTFSLFSSVIPLSILFGAGVSLLLDDDDDDDDDDERFNDIKEQQQEDEDEEFSQQEEEEEEEENEDEAKNTTSTSTSTLDVSSAYQDVRDVRLNYIITQVDISRMARNASRHLDVKSILSLPTIVYQEQITTIIDDTAAVVMEEEDNDDGISYDSWSWQIVQPTSDKDDTNATQIVQQEETTYTTDACVICLESFQQNELLRVLPCNHLFHIGCIDHWLLGTYSEDECYTMGCPTCKKRPTITEGEDDDHDHNELHTNQPVVATPQPIIDGSVPSWAFTHLGNILATNQQEQDDLQLLMQDEEAQNQEEVVVILPTSIVTVSSDDSSSSGNVLLDASSLSCSDIFRCE